MNLTEKTLLNFISERKRTISSMLRKFGYNDNLIKLLKRLEKKGLIEHKPEWKTGWREVFKKREG